jgi:hypothetical protein
MSSARPATLRVRFYDGRQPVGAEATLLLAGSTAKLIGAELARDFALARLRVSPRVGAADRFVALPDGGQLQCPDNPALDRLPQEGKAEGVVAWLERRWWVALVCLALTVGGLAFGYVYGLPVAAERIAARIPIEYERELGEQTISWLDENGLFGESELDPETRQAIAAGFTEFTRELPLAAHYRLEFRAAPAIGPNAFALPGGIVVVTDELVDLSETLEEVLAVLAHEIGHVEHRHALRHLLQDSATAVLAATVASDASSLTHPLFARGRDRSRRLRLRATETPPDLARAFRHGHGKVARRRRRQNGARVVVPLDPSRHRRPHRPGARRRALVVPHKRDAYGSLILPPPGMPPGRPPGPMPAPRSGITIEELAWRRIS